jgi:hypothetical protein
VEKRKYAACKKNIKNKIKEIENKKRKKLFFLKVFFWLWRNWW